MAKPLDTTRPFTRAAALKAGITPKRLRGSHFRRVFRDAYVDASVVDTPRLRVAAALLLHCTGAAASHASAARVYDLPIPTIPEEHVTVRDAAQRRRREGIRCHFLARHRTRVQDGVLVSTPEQLFVEMGTLLTLVDHVVLGDSMVRRGLTTPEKLRKSAANAAGHGAAAAREAATYVRRDVDSPMETRLRMLLVLAGVPEPEVNQIIRDVDGEPIRRHDLSWPGARTAAEYDGRQHVEREENWEADLTRREESDNDEWRMLVFVSGDIYKTPGRTVERVWRVLKQGRLSGLPARPRDDWRPHFPGY